ncbi:MAG: polysaccharide deacetylase family protein [Cytophagaceae bacterium]|nr:polysaccharide deacetylase family protein [Cytophagaceae bacterium]
MKTYLFLIIFFSSLNAFAQTYAEKLGFPAGKKVIILHVDDAGMSYDSNLGVIEAMEKGVANSTSVMMPCGWVADYFKHLKAHPNTDAGVHLTLTSEWDSYRWQPLVGKEKAPGLYDGQGSFWRSVAQVVEHATPDEVETEIRAQIARFRAFGIEPTHLDSHMGTLFAPKFIERYVKVGIAEKIPVMMPGGHNTLISRQQQGGEALMQAVRSIGQTLWNAGLPVLDDLHNESYGWNLPAGEKVTDDKLRRMKTAKYIEALKACQPGLTMVIMHCTAPTEVFDKISNSGTTRKGDLLAMTDPDLRKFIEKEGIILTTWREVKERRGK